MILQVEALADGFSGMAAVAAVPWQARKHLFQELQLQLVRAFLRPCLAYWVCVLDCSSHLRHVVPAVNRPD